MKLHHTAFALALVAAGIGSCPAPTHAMTAIDIIDLTEQVHNMSDAVAHFSQARAGQVLGWEGTRSTSTPQANAVPTCRMKTDKWVYKVGEPVQISWSTENAAKGYIQITDAAGGSFTVASMTAATKEGTATWTATAPGFAKITGAVQSSTQNDRTCLQTISIVTSSTSLKDTKTNGLTAVVMQKQEQAKRIQSEITVMQGRLTQLQDEIAALMARITNVQSATSTRPAASSTRAMMPRRDGSASTTSPFSFKRPLDSTKPATTTTTSNF